MNLEELKECLAREGWAVEEISDVTMRSRFQGAQRTFPLFIHVSAQYVTFAVIPFARMPPEPEDADALARRLLQLNRAINMAKFSVDEDGDVVLSVEYRIEDLDPSEVRDAMDLLSFYADKHHDEVQRLASP